MVRYEDATVVDRAELIVVGHLKDNSIQYVPHPNAENLMMADPSQHSESSNAPPHPLSWEYHALLITSEVIKGESTNQEIPIIIHYGLDVVFGRDSRDGEIEMGNGGARKVYPTNLVRIFRTRGSLIIEGEGPVVEDASEDNIWFLRRGTGIYGEKPGTNDLGVMDPEDIQPVKMKGYFKSFLSDDRVGAVKAYAGAVKAYAAAHPEVTLRVERWLDRLSTTAEWESVKAIKDPQTKARRMASYLRATTAPKGASMLYRDLREEMPKLGADAVPVLIEVLRAGMTNGEDLNLPVLILHQIGRPAEPAVPVLCELLEKPGKTLQYYICSALKTAQDPKAIPFVRPMLKLEDMQTATEAAEALAAMGDTESFDAIAALLPHLKAVKSSMDELHMYDLLRVLHQLDRQRAAPIVKRYMEDPAWAEMRDLLNPGD